MKEHMIIFQFNMSRMKNISAWIILVTIISTSYAANLYLPIGGISSGHTCSPIIFGVPWGSFLEPGLLTIISSLRTIVAYSFHRQYRWIWISIWIWKILNWFIEVVEQTLWLSYFGSSNTKTPLLLDAIWRIWFIINSRKWMEWWVRYLQYPDISIIA